MSAFFFKYPKSSAGLKKKQELCQSADRFVQKNGFYSEKSAGEVIETHNNWAGVEQLYFLRRTFRLKTHI